MFPALLTTFLWAVSAVCGARSARLMGGVAANFWRLVFAVIALGVWARWFGQWFGGSSLPLFVLSGVIGVGADVFLFMSYTRIGSRLTLLIIQCGSAIAGAVLEWVWKGETLTGWQIAASLVILGGVAVALAPGKHVEVTRRMLLEGIILSSISATGTGIGAVLSHQAYAVAKAAGEDIDAPTGAFQRVVGGLAVAAVFMLVLVFRTARAARAGAPKAPAVVSAGKWKLGWPWVVSNAFAGQVLGITCYQWALKTTATGLVLAIVATAPLAIIPFSSVMEGEKITMRSLFGGILAVAGVVLLVTMGHK